MLNIIMPALNYFTGLIMVSMAVLTAIGSGIAMMLYSDEYDAESLVQSRLVLGLGLTNMVLMLRLATEFFRACLEA